jgi:hypothetical protein
LAELLVGTAPIPIGEDIVGLDADGLAVVDDGRLELALPRKRQAPIVSGVIEQRIDLERAFEIGERQVEIALALVHETALVEGARALRIEPEKLGEVGEGTIVLPHHGERSGAAQQCRLVLRRELEGLRKPGWPARAARLPYAFPRLR